MKKIKYLIIAIVIGILLIPITTNAAGSISVSTSSLSITKGSSKNFTITANNAAGKVNITSSNPSVAAVSTSTEFLDNSSITVRVTGANVGKATITIYSEDVTTYDDENISGRSHVISVSVNEPYVPPVDNRSKNNNLKEISVDGYKLEKVDNNNYVLSVKYDVTKINLFASAEDSKASVSGIGEKDLIVGENTFEVIITAENGSQNKIIVKVTRKDGYYLDDLSTVLNNSNIDNADIIIVGDDKITASQLEEIKKSKKKVNLTYLDGNKAIVYSIMIDGTKIKDIKEFSPSINFTTENINEIAEKSNYADGMYLNFKENGQLPKGTIIKLFVGDRFDNKNIVNVYNYNKETKELTSLKHGLEVKDGYIEFDIEECSEYFVTRATVSSAKETNSNKVNVFLIVSVIELIILIVIIVLDYLKINPIAKLKKEKQIVNKVPVVQTQTNTMPTTIPTPEPLANNNNNNPNNGAI